MSKIERKKITWTVSPTRRKVSILIFPSTELNLQRSQEEWEEDERKRQIWTKKYILY